MNGPHGGGGVREMQARRCARAALEAALAAKPCPCGRPDWRVTSTQGRVRYLKCRTCGRSGKHAVRSL